MSSPIAHSAVWFALWPAIRRRVRALSPLRRVFLGASLFGALLAPDADTLLALTAGQRVAEVHNYGSHSLFAGMLFAVPFAIVCGLAGGRGWLFFGAIGWLAYASHVLIDAITFGRGVQMFWPLTDRRFGGRGFCILYGVRHSVEAPLVSHLLTIANDLAFAGVVLGFVVLFRRFRVMTRRQPEPA